MERRAGPGRLAHRTAHAIIKARTVPKDIRTYIAFLETCEITGPALIPWFDAWAKAYGTGRIPTVIRRPTPGEQLFADWAASRTGTVLSDFPIIDGQQRISSIIAFCNSDVRTVEVAA
ncbi:hypothetical protein AB0K89_10650 [Streptomyces cinnamoneus]|uniref:hypothetical protein n=1 Tax=Streptomyces cinnamoneus TaxID=53446 RepID=UPI003421D952